MKQVSLILNIVLLLALGFLYYKVYSNEKPAAKPGTLHSVQSSAGTSNNEPVKALIAYVELDSLNDQISYIKSRRTQLEAEQKAIENEWQSGYKGLEAKKDNFIKVKGQTMTQEEAEKFQIELMQQQQAIDSRKQTQLQNLSEKSYKFMEDIQKKLKEFLADYNKDKNFQYILTTGTGLDYLIFKDSTLNITADVVTGMNKVFSKN
ncbi:MAG TPA: OmpH family outer membrane protein [Ferruginibacter sp.]|nr:OmpH family outer membrane protein [Bacteroidota bacterium]MBS1925907.1 OmpH family outer membrane protein [Bacteroidota bacterium]HMT95439.1 OmpH family outer membrane protein [Ferruginibacter sp.]HMU24652.1 OmpH family outer membrane protein [Ferruginibacter sp.]